MKIDKSIKKILTKEGIVILGIEALGFFILFVLRSLIGFIFGGIFYDPSAEMYIEVTSKVGYFIIFWGYGISIIVRGIIWGLKH